MNIDPYNARVRELFADTRHAGVVDAATTVRLEDQGVRVQLMASTENGRIDALGYLIHGCPHSIAVCEAICRDLVGTDCAGLENFSVAELMQSLAVPAAKSGRILALEDAVRQLSMALREANSPSKSD